MIFCVFCDAKMDPEADAYECVKNCQDFYACKVCYDQDLCKKVAKHQHHMRPLTKKTHGEAHAQYLRVPDLD